MPDFKDYEVYKDGKLFWKGKACWEMHAIIQAQSVFFDAQVENESRPQYNILNILNAKWVAKCVGIIRKPKIRRKARK